MGMTRTASAALAVGFAASLAVACADVNMRDDDLRVDGATGMMSTRDSDELLRDPDPASPIPDPAP